MNVATLLAMLLSAGVCDKADFHTPGGGMLRVVVCPMLQAPGGEQQSAPNDAPDDAPAETPGAAPAEPPKPKPESPCPSAPARQSRPISPPPLIIHVRHGL